jgi:hypothetical protein
MPASIAHAIFKDVVYWIADPVSAETRHQAEEDLRRGGAKRAITLADASHIITESMDFFGYPDANPDAIRVTVSRSKP